MRGTLCFHLIELKCFRIFQCIGYDYTACIDYMNLAICYLRKAVKLNHSLTSKYSEYQLINYNVLKYAGCLVIPYHCLQSVIHWIIKTLRQRQIGRQFADNIFKFIFFKWNFVDKISRKYVSKGPIDNKPALVQIRAFRQTGNKPLPETMIAWFEDTYMHCLASVS